MNIHTIVRTANSLYVKVCTDTQEQMAPGRAEEVETMVFKCSEEGFVSRSGYQRPVDVAWCKTDDEGTVQHHKMVDKWMNEVLIF